MHSESTTDLSIPYSNLSRNATNNDHVVLIKTGSLNHVHRSHLSSFIRPKEYLERVHHFNAIGGYLSSSHDEYVQSKLAYEYISNQRRIEMCQTAIEEAGQQHWLTVDKAECMDKLNLFSE